MRLILFGSGSPLSRAAFEALADRFDLAAVVRPAAPSTLSWRAVRSWLGGGHARELATAARARGVPVIDYERSGPRFGPALASLGPDLLCVASFPHLLSPDRLAAARHGGLNLHPSLLPRHRGPDPLFWTYLTDDRSAGVTVHHIDAGADTGDIVLQEAIPLARGRPLASLYADVVAAGVPLLVRAVEEMAAGRAPRRPQDPAQATQEPAGSHHSPLPVREWPVERTWHVLAGLGAVHHDLLETEGRRLGHGPARTFRNGSHGRRPGEIEATPDGWRVYGPDGLVDVAPWP